jgi:hypothetical protein
MKQFLAASGLAVLLLAGVQQSASAWCAFRFGIGLDVGFSCGNNCCLWGLYHNGQVPTPPCPFDLVGPGYGGPGWPVYGFGFGHTPPASHGYVPPAGRSYTPPTPANDFIGPQPTPAPSSSSYLMPPASSAPAQTTGYSYPAGYYPMSYPAGYYYPMSYNYPAYYGR